MRVGQKSVIHQNSISSSHLRTVEQGVEPTQPLVLLDIPKTIERLGLLSQPHLSYENILIMRKRPLATTLSKIQMTTAKNAVYSITERKSVHLSLRVGQVVSRSKTKTSLMNFTTISYLVSLCSVYLLQCLQYLFTSRRVGFGVLLSLIEQFRDPQTVHARLAFFNAMTPPFPLLQQFSTSLTSCLDD